MLNLGYNLGLVNIGYNSSKNLGFAKIVNNLCKNLLALEGWLRSSLESSDDNLGYNLCKNLGCVKLDNKLRKNFESGNP